jgi:hypothetical protein
MASNGDSEAALRSLREISHIADGPTVKAMKGLIERQIRVLGRLDELEEEVASLRKAAKAVAK